LNNDAICCGANVVDWHVSDLPARPLSGRYQGQTGRGPDMPKIDTIDPKRMWGVRRSTRDNVDYSGVWSGLNREPNHDHTALEKPE